MNEGANEEKKKMRKFTRKHKRGRKRREKQGKKFESFTFYSAKKKLFLLLYFKAIRDVSSVPSGFFIYTCTVFNSFFATTQRRTSNENKGEDL